MKNSEESDVIGLASESNDDCASDKESVVKDSTTDAKKEEFKTPSLVGLKIGKIPGKIKPKEPILADEKILEDKECSISKDSSDQKSITSVSTPLNTLPLPYQEPRWSGVPSATYSFEVLKSGKIVDTVDLSTKPFYVLGRITSCDVVLAHPTISRYHAVIQFKDIAESDSARGFYVYDLGSTHGTFLNKYRVKPKTYTRIHVGHMLKLGCSTRMFILQGPDTDAEPESELSVTELKERRNKLEMGTAEDDSEGGVNWGIGSDAEEENDLEENPYACTNNEELYIDDPKKALRDWFSREGYDLEYQVEEKGYSQFLCKVDLPIDSAPAGTVRAEAFVKGKKKESVVQCALEACRILDRYNVLHQSHQESKKRKAKNWEDDDFYDSDEDNFFDRTGNIEEKRKRRMAAAGKLAKEVETYETLNRKYETLLSEISMVEKRIFEIEASSKSNNDNEDEDPLDSYMRSVSSGVQDSAKLKTKLEKLRREEERLKNLINITKPASLNLPIQSSSSESSVK